MKNTTLQNILIWTIGILLIVLVSSVFYFQNKITLIIQNHEQSQKEIKNENTISRTFFEDTFELWNYKNTQYTLEESAHAIIDGIRNMHQAPILIDWAVRDKELCAWFIWLLSEEIWWKNLPYYIGMMDQETRSPAQAWKLADSYKYFGGKILYDFSWKFDPYKRNLWEKINTKDIQEFFVQAFSESALFGDIWFLYNSTKYTPEIIESWNYNSHITKNMWLSTFHKRIEKVEKQSHIEIFQENFSCTSEISEKIFPILEYYKFQLNEKNIILDWDDFYYIDNENVKQEKVTFWYLDKLSYNDVTLTHFFEWNSHVDSLLEMTCKWEFLPINILSINPRLIEKK